MAEKATSFMIRLEPPILTLARVESHLKQRLTRPLPGSAAQRRFASHPPKKGWSPDLRPPNARPAAALILVYPGPEDLLIPLTVRPDHLPDHPGQVSLPGGGVDPGESAVGAALREAAEEIGIDAPAVRVLGTLSTVWIDVSRFVVQPVVGVLDRRPTFRLAANEVEALIEVPLAHLLDERTIGRAAFSRRSPPVEHPFFAVGGHRVWGATAIMLGEFIALFDNWPPGP